MVLVSGSIVGAFILAAVFLFFGSSWSLAVTALIGALTYGAAFGLTGGLVFFPIFFVLRLARSLNAYTLVFLGGAALGLIGVSTQAAVPEIFGLALVGAVSGFVAFRTLASCAKRDSEEYGAQ
jgi:hypothetical protein